MCVFVYETHRQREGEGKRESARERERESARARERARERERERARERERESCVLQLASFTRPSSLSHSPPTLQILAVARRLSVFGSSCAEYIPEKTKERQRHRRKQRAREKREGERREKREREEREREEREREREREREERESARVLGTYSHSEYCAAPGVGGMLTRFGCLFGLVSG